MSCQKAKQVEVVDNDSKQQIEDLKLEIQDLEAKLSEAKKKLRELGGAKVRVNTGVKDFVKPLLDEGKTNKEILELVHQHYGNENTTYACVAWYRNNLKK